MKKMWKSLAVLMSLLAFFGFGLASCSSDDDDDGGSQPSPKPAVTQPTLETVAGSFDFGTATVTINADGTVSVINSDGTTVTGKVEVSETEGIIIKDSEGNVLYKASVNSDGTLKTDSVKTSSGEAVVVKKIEKSYDGSIFLTLDAAPVYTNNSVIHILLGEAEVDTITLDDTYYTISGTKGAMSAIKVKDQLVSFDNDGNVVIVTHTDSNGYSKLYAGKTYTVKIDDTEIGTYTTKENPTIENKTISVGSDGNFTTIQGALNYLRKTEATGDWTINVAEGKYHERLAYYGNANVTLVGAESEYGEKTYVYWMNNENWKNSGQRARASFVWVGGNLTIKNMKFENTTNRTREGNTNVQAETLNFDVAKDLVVYNSSFYSYQDTLILGNNGGRAWFYKSKIAGDVDFIWGTANVALIEDCKIICRADGIKNDAKIFASRTVATNDTVGKGFILLNCDVEIEDGCAAAYGRSSGADTQASVINCKFTKIGAGALNKALWGSASDTRIYEANGEMAVGYKDYKNYIGEEIIDTSNRLAKTADMSERIVNREYSGRWVIFNRVYNRKTGAYVFASDLYDINTIAASYSAPEDNSIENIFVEPVYTKSIVGGNTVNLAIDTKASGLTYTYETSDSNLATVADGVVSTIAGADGKVKITVTASNGKKDEVSLVVYPTYVYVESVTVSAPSSVDMYALGKATATVSPADAIDQTLTWTATGDLRIVDPDNKVLVTELTTSSASVQFESTVSGGSGTITASAADTQSGTPATNSATVSVTKVRDYNAVEAVAVNSKDKDSAFGILNFQGGKVGMWHDLYVHAIYNGTNGKIAASTDRVQSRYGTIYIPVTKNCYIDLACQKKDDTNDFVNDFVDLAGNSPVTSTGEEEEGTYKFHYKWELDVTNDTAKLKSGADVLALYNASTKDTSRSWTDHAPDSTAKYFGIVIPGNDRYWAHLTITEDDSIYHAPPAAELSITTDFASATKTLDLGGTTTVTQTIVAASSDSTAPIVTYSSDNTAAATVDASTGVVTAVGMGVANITATVAHATDSNVSKLTSSYVVTVKDTEVTSGYAINLTGVAGANKSGSWDFGKFSATGAKFHGSTYGWVWSADGTVTFHVTGSSNITLCNSYTNVAGTASVTATAGTVTSSFDTTKGDYKSSPAEFVLNYEGDAADITVTFAGETYLSKIDVVDASYSSTVSANTLFDLRDIFSALPTSGSAASGSVKATGGEITYSAMYYKDTTHGAYMLKTSTISFTVSGACTIWLGKDSFNGATYTIASTANGLSATKIDAGIQNTDSAATLASDVTDLTSDGAAAVSFEYTGSGETTITISVTGQSTTNYLPAVQVVF